MCHTHTHTHPHTDCFLTDSRTLLIEDFDVVQLRSSLETDFLDKIWNLALCVDEVPGLLLASCHSKAGGEAKLKLLIRENICSVSFPLLPSSHAGPPPHLFPTPNFKYCLPHFLSFCGQSYLLFTQACSQKLFCFSGKAWKIPEVRPRSG